MKAVSIYFVGSSPLLHASSVPSAAGKNDYQLPSPLPSRKRRKVLMYTFNITTTSIGKVCTRFDL